MSLDSNPSLLPRSAKATNYILAGDNAFQTAERTNGRSDGSTPTDHTARSSVIAATNEASPSLDGPSFESIHPDGGPEMTGEDGRDPDDFIIMDEKQAKRIVALCEMAFDVELSIDVVVADANVSLLSRRIVGARSLTGNTTASANTVGT